MEYSLDTQQREAVQNKAKNVVVVAGAGSGKTRVIVERIRWLLLTGVQANSIVAITYTNMAAQEMKARLRDIPRSGDMFIGTIHSFANQILHNSGKAYEIFNEQKQNDFMRFLCRKYGRHLTFDRYLEYMEANKNVSLGLLDESALSEFTKGEVFELNVLLGKTKVKDGDKEYPTNVWKLCKNNHIITFDELLVLSGDYFKQKGAQGIAHLLVDELQDIGQLEYNFLRALKAEHNFFVGDDWQAIYAFKGGNVKIFKSLLTSSEWVRVDLVNNYRCGQDILIAATEIINQCDDIVEKDVYAVTKHRGEVTVGSKFQLEMWLQKIASAAMLEASDPNRMFLSDWFILVRSNKDLMEVSRRLDAMSVPFSTFRKADLSYAQLQDIMVCNTVKLLTIHMAKGLEADNVLMWGNFPMYPPSYLINKEERRVMYVGATRAKKHLIILK